jgi:hypothetical protein
MTNAFNFMVTQMVIFSYVLVLLPGGRILVKVIQVVH